MRNKRRTEGTPNPFPLLIAGGVGNFARARKGVYRSIGGENPGKLCVWRLTGAFVACYTLNRVKARCGAFPSIQFSPRSHSDGYSVVAVLS